MISKSQLKYYTLLLQKKYRESERKFIVEGKKIVEEGLSSKYECEMVFVLKDFAAKEKNFIEKLNIKNKMKVLSTIEFNKISDTKSPQGIAAVFLFKNVSNDIEMIKSELIIGLENINDPGNLGTIMRTCDWFNLKNILISKDSVEIFNPKVIRSSMGSIFHLNLYREVDFKTELQLFKNKGYQLICADTEGENIYEYNFSQKTILFFCNEANGPSKDLLSIIDEKISIPKYGEAESLNVSAAVSAILSEYKRKKDSH